MEEKCRDVVVIGSGGFGLVLLNECARKVTKLLYEGHCSDAKIEYAHILNARKALAGLHHVHVPRPYKYEENKISFDGKTFSCGLSMQYMTPPPGHDVLIHCMINNDIAPNRVVGKVYREPVSATNPPRGFYASADFVDGYIKTRRSPFKSVDDIAYAIGAAYARLVTRGRMYPFDVEFLLFSNKGSIELCVIDYGLAINIGRTETIAQVVKRLFYGDNAAGLSGDLYIPQSDNPLFQHWSQGLKDEWNKSATNCSADTFVRIIEALDAYDDSILQEPEHQVPFFKQGQKRRGTKQQPCTRGCVGVEKY